MFYIKFGRRFVGEKGVEIHFNRVSLELSTLCTLVQIAAKFCQVKLRVFVRFKWQ